MKYLVILSLVGMVAYGQTGKASDPKNPCTVNGDVKFSGNIRTNCVHAKPKKPPKKAKPPTPPGIGDYSGTPDLPKLCGPKSDEQCIPGGVDKAAVPAELQKDFIPLTGSDGNIATYSSFAIADRDGDCTWHGFEYDAKTKTCNLTITFSVPTQLVCTPLVLNGAGEPTMKCSYPVVAVEKAK